MKKSLFGCCVVGALALGVTALAAPRTTNDAARGMDKGKTEVTRLVTGDPAQINAVAAYPTTAIVAIVPVAAKVGSYPAGTTVVGNTLSADAGGFMGFFEAKISNWDPDGDNDPPLKVYQIKMDCSGFSSGPGAPLAEVMIPCTNDAAGNLLCRGLFGEDWAKCESSFCKQGYLDKGGSKRPADNWCAPDGCDAGDVATSTCNYNFFSVYSAVRTDGHIVYYAGSMVLNIPALAKGTYTVPLNPSTSETFLADSSAPPIDIPILERNGFVVNIRTGSCCFGLGTPGAGCTDGLLKSECGDDEPAPFIWTEGKLCSAGCVECINDAGCNDNDSCTTETCNTTLGVCSRGRIAGWTAGKCCEGDGGTAVLTTLDDGDACTVDTCVNNPPPNPGPPAQENGTATHTPAPSSTLCDDLNPCSVGDHCDGTHSQQNGGCVGTDVNSLSCASAVDCPLDPLGQHYACGTANAGKCFCTLTPKVTFVLDTSSGKTCVGGFNAGLPCARDSDCPGGGVCDVYFNGANCYDAGAKITAMVRVGSAASPINGGEFLITYNPSCLTFNSATPQSPYQNVVAPVANASAGTIFVAVGVNPFGGVNGPLGNSNLVNLSFTKVGSCGECSLCFAQANPLHSYLVDDEGQQVTIDPECKSLRGKGDLVLDVPGTINTNRDCNGPTAVETWAPPTATFSCGTATLTCRGAHETGYTYPQSVVLNGGQFPAGASSFCCYAAANDACDQHAGCAGPVNDCPGGAVHQPEGCWTVNVSDNTAVDIDIQLEPPIATSDLTRCIKFCLFASAAEPPVCFEDVVEFGGMFNFIGKSRGNTVKVPGDHNWICMTAQDQLHTLRSCDSVNSGALCGADGVLHAQFIGDPELGGNWLVGGNLDGWKKDIPGSGASLDVIDILDFGMFVSQYGANYPVDTNCSTQGPNADINGDGTVNQADYNILIKHFLASAKECCGGPQADVPANPLTEVTVDQLRQMGYGELVVADLNGDGVVNAQDMDAFMQGVRPTKTNRGGKGMRSGR